MMNSTRSWISCLSLLVTFSGACQTDSLSKCACIDSLIEIDEQIIQTYRDRNNEVSESSQAESGKRFMELHKAMKRISVDCENQLISEKVCERESELLERKEEVQLIIRVIEINGRYYDE